MPSAMGASLLPHLMQTAARNAHPTQPSPNPAVIAVNAHLTKCNSAQPSAIQTLTPTLVEQ